MFWPRDRNKRECRERQIEQKDASDDFAHGKATISGALVEMCTVRLPDRLSAGDAAHERNRSVGQIIERQDDSRCQMPAAGELQQYPADQKPDRQTAHIAKEDFRHGPIEWREADDRTKQGSCDDSRQCSNDAAET